jgi:hypothetical protein
VLFAAASRDARRVEAAPAAARDEERFFVMRRAPRTTRGAAAVPADLLALQIERHVRLEQAVAEAFRQFPSVEALHSRTLSPLAG